MAVALLLAAMPVSAQESITLPVTFANQKQWKATKTTITLYEGAEEQAAYELQDFKRIDHMRRSGQVFYVPVEGDDRIVLALKNVEMTNEQLPAIIDNQTDKDLYVWVIGRTTLINKGSIIRSRGSVLVLGEERDSLTFDNRITLYSKGAHNLACIEAVGDVTLQDLDVDISSSGSYGVRTIPIGQENSVLVLNHVKGTMKGQRDSTHGFDVIEGNHCEVQGVEVNFTEADLIDAVITDEAEPTEKEEPQEEEE